MRPRGAQGRRYVRSLTLAWLRVLVVLITAVWALAACGGGESNPTAAPLEDAGVSMGGAALGGNAETTLLAREALGRPPAGDVAWVAHEVRLDDGRTLEHSHEFAFVYAKEGIHRLQHGSDDQQMERGEGAAIPAGASHVHEAPQGPSLFWEIRLAPPGSEAPPGTPDARSAFESGVLGGIPGSSVATFVLVRVPPGGRTSVHTHPGPEFIYQLTGEIEYQNGVIGSISMVPGDAEGIPPGVTVQKRNPFDEDATFLSWFLVDPVQPFASPAVFPASPERGENLAMEDRGGRVVGVSSNYGSAGMDSTFGANNALDGDPSTEWSSDGDGDGAWIEVELAEESRVRSLGFWTRTMGTSAEIRSFQVVSDSGQIQGPFTLEDAAGIHYFDTALTAKRLRFEAVESSGGNTGVVEIEVYGDPVP